MKIFIKIILLLLLSISATKAQYKYDNYKYPDVTVRGLSLYLDFNANQQGNFFGRSIPLNLEYRHNIYYTKFQNDSIQQKIDEFSFDNYMRNTSEDNYYNVSLSKRQIKRNFFKPSSKFLGIKGKNFEFNHEIYLNNFKNEVGNGINGSLSTTLALGFGRLHPVTEIFVSQFLMDDLIKEGLLKEKFTENELFELAALMVKIKSKRVFDSRRSRMYQMTELSNWLEGRGIQQTIKTFNIISDNLYYANSFNGLIGSSLSYGVKPNIRLAFQKTIKNENIDSKYYSLISYINFQKEQALNQYYNVKYRLNVARHIYSYDTGLKKINTFEAEYALKYFPSSRTSASAIARNIVSTSDLKKFEAEMSIFVDFNYFINYQMVINAELSFRFDYPSNINIRNNFENSIIISSWPENLRFDIANYTNQYYFTANINFSYSFF